MDENVRNDAKQVMLVQQADDGRLQAVSGMDENGNIRTVSPSGDNIMSLLNVSTLDSPLEAFFKKFWSKLKIPPIPAFSL